MVNMNGHAIGSSGDEDGSNEATAVTALGGSVKATRRALNGTSERTPRVPSIPSGYSTPLHGPIPPAAFTRRLPRRMGSKYLRRLSARPATYAEAHSASEARNIVMDSKSFYTPTPRQFLKLQPREAMST